MTRLTAVLAALLATASPGAAQTPTRSPAQDLTALARAQIDDINADSARTLLIVALRASTTPVEKLRAFTLLAIAELNRKNANAARDAFVLALAIDPLLRIDSLVFLDNEAPTVFAAARSIAGTSAVAAPEARVVLLLTVLLPTDTVVAAADGRLPIIVQPNAASRTITMIAAASAPGVALWSDTQSTAGRHRIVWPLRRSDGTVWPEGRYVLRAQATDSNGQATPFEERVLRVSRVAVDTQPHPPQLPATAFAPEALAPAGHTAPRLLAGTAVALLAAIAPAMLGSPDLNSGLSSDPTSYAVAGGVAVASVIGFVKGRRPHPLTQNIRKNKDLRESDQRQRDAVTAANAEARLKAPIRVIVERAP